MNQQETILIGAQPEASPAGAVVTVALVIAVIGAALAVAGVNALFGAGWALVAGSLPFFAVAALMLRGLKHA